MIRVLVFLAALLALAFGFSWLADHPGELTLVWQGVEMKTSTMVVAIAIVAFTAAVLAVFALLRGLVRTPGAVGSFFTRRKRERGWRALSQGMIAVGAGDPSTAGRLAQEARRVLGAEPLALLLEAQAAQLSGDRAAAHEAFERMLEDPETRLLGLRGLYVEAGRYNDATAARHFAEEANTLAPRVGWAGQALLEFQSQDRDWDGALATLDRNARHKIVDKPRAKRLRAVVLTARALEIEMGEPDLARNFAMEAHGLAPELVPAAVVAARLMARAGDIKRAARVIETTWRQEPHPDLADAYAHLRPGDSAQDRLARIKDLIRVRAHHTECAFALARAELEARNVSAARAALKPVMQPAPTRRACLIMAEIEEAEHGASGKVRGWRARAARAPRDPSWIADGFVAERWAPVSPVTGRLDAFEWKVPADLLGGPVTDPFDEADDSGDETASLLSVEQARPEPARPAPMPTAAEAEPEKAPPATEPSRAELLPPDPGRPAPSSPSASAATPPSAAPAREKAKSGAPERKSEPALIEAKPEPAKPTGPTASAGTSAAEPAKPTVVASDKVVILPKASGETRSEPPRGETVKPEAPKADVPKPEAARAEAAKSAASYVFAPPPDDPGPDAGAADGAEAGEPGRRFRLFS
ncbi:heme biosynthesis protein HemY [Prosthecodimorpha staleyi]|uniref:Heme biosynthesis protein HemY n=1 Tax=Prosthecodimorpha staleyi TaxID=2840188 RepID=A0A947D4S9_9HYPH|nr:heme biosynthesis HemY N-terminal domain-containing protein [Prosthecodimorpha staleyi]MBT9289571.1 heme biosynthesis protein HemY [Prosthecodimorpha staleyi]